MTIQEDLQYLTSTVEDVRHKPLLRSTVEAELLKRNHNPEEVAATLDDFFKVTLQ